MHSRNLKLLFRHPPMSCSVETIENAYSEGEYQKNYFKQKGHTSFLMGCRKKQTQNQQYGYLPKYLTLVGETGGY